MGAMWKAIAARGTTPLTYLALVVVWEAFVRAFNIAGWILPSPSAIVATAITWAPELFFHSLATLRETLIGFGLALIFSLPLAVVIAFTTTLRRLLYPILLGLQSIPKVALAPLVILWLGVGELPKIAIVTLVCFFPILVNLVAGFEAVPGSMLDLMRSLRASEYITFRRLRIPVALPHLF